jgi:predicted Zn-dependent peptidase
MNFPFERHTLPNGLRVLIQPDNQTPMVAVNLLYNVGARDEDPEWTGLAHLLEHLMFEGSKHIPFYDQPLQLAGGINNAFTNNDITNYYCVLPAANLRTALWLEADRMCNLNLSEEKVEVQRKVVIEEFRQRYLNQPYGDLLALTRELSYTQHPYRWSTIGKSIEHIEQVPVSVIRGFYEQHYAPNRCILVLSGNLDPQQALREVEYWFGDLPSRALPKKPLPTEPPQTQARLQQVFRPVPEAALWMGWPMPGRNHPDFKALDLFSDVLSGSAGGYTMDELIRKRGLLNQGGFYVSGSADPGQFLFSATLREGKKNQEVAQEIQAFLFEIAEERLHADDLHRATQKMATSNAFSDANVQNRALRLAMAEWLGGAESLSTEWDEYASLGVADVQAAVRRYLKPECSSTLLYETETNA